MPGRNEVVGPLGAGESQDILMRAYGPRYLPPAQRGTNVTKDGRRGFSNCLHHLAGRMWVLWEKCFEKLLRVGRRIPRNLPKGLTTGQRDPLPQLLFMNWRFFFFSWQSIFYTKCTSALTLHCQLTFSWLVSSKWNGHAVYQCVHF